MRLKKVLSLWIVLTLSAAWGQTFRDSDAFWAVDLGVMLTLGLEDIEIKPFLQTSYSAELGSNIGIDAGVRLELYTAYPKYGVNHFAVGGDLSTYLGFGVIPGDTPLAQVRANSIDVRSFGGSGPTMNGLQAGYSVTQWFGGFVGGGEGGLFGWKLSSRAGALYAGYGDENVRLRVTYGNDNLPLGDHLDSNESAFGSVEVGNEASSFELGFRNVTDYILYGPRGDVADGFKLSDPTSSGYRLAGEPYTDKERGLGTYLVKGPGVKQHVVFLGGSSGPAHIRLGVRGQLAYNLTQGRIHSLIGAHGLPHDDGTSLFLEAALDLSVPPEETVLR